MRAPLAIRVVALGLWCLGSSVAGAGDAVAVYRNGTDGYNNFRIPSIVQAADGTLLAFCEGRDAGDAGQADLVLKRSSDEGRSWSELQIVQSHDNFRSYFGESPPPITVGNPTPVVDRLDPEFPGRIWLMFTLENIWVFVTFSDDHGASWSSPREITSDVKRKEWGWYATGPCHAIQLRGSEHRGRLVFPADHRLGEPGKDKGQNGAQLVLSDDHGQSWRLGAIDDSYDDGLNANETSVCELSDGTIYVNTRDQNGPAPGTRGGSLSTDGGATFVAATDSQWPAFQPVQELTTPVVQCSVLSLQRSKPAPAADMILFSGPDEAGPTGPGRSDLRVWYSLDGAKSWKKGPLLHEGPAAYSDMVELAGSDSRVGILYEAGDPERRRPDRIDFQVFDTDGFAGAP